MLETYSHTLSNKLFLLVKIHMDLTKFIWDPHDLVWPVWVVTNKRVC